MTRLKRGALCAFLASATALLVAAPPAQAIINGEKATESYPFMGSLQNPQSPRPDGHACGATLVDKEWMVTARHCVDGRGGFDTMKVRIGSPRVDRGGEVIGVEKAVWPSGGIHGDDIALIKLKRPAAATPAPIATDVPGHHAPVRILGWGLTGPKMIPANWPKDLRQLDTERLPDGKCDDSGIVHGKEICIAAVNGRGAATMDSGGPALIKTKGAWTLVGVTSGSGADPNVEPVDPTVYTNVTIRADWIKSVINS